MKTFIGVQDLHGDLCYMPIDQIMFVKSREHEIDGTFSKTRRVYKIFMHGGGTVQTYDDVPKLLEGKCTSKK